MITSKKKRDFDNGERSVRVAAVFLPLSQSQPYPVFRIRISSHKLRLRTFPSYQSESRRTRLLHLTNLCFNCRYFMFSSPISFFLSLSLMAAWAMTKCVKVRVMDSPYLYDSRPAACLLRSWSTGSETTGGGGLLHWGTAREHVHWCGLGN